MSFKGQPAKFVGNGWLVDQSGNFWSIRRGAGLQLIDSAGKTTRQYTRAADGLPSDTLRGLLEDGAGKIWVLSQTGISWIDAAKTFHHYPLPYPQDFNNFYSSEERVVEVHQRRNGEIMWGDRRFLYFFNPKTQTFRRLALPGSTPQLGVQWICAGPAMVLPGGQTTTPEEYLERLGTIYRYDDANGLAPRRQRPHVQARGRPAPCWWIILPWSGSAPTPAASTRSI